MIKIKNIIVLALAFFGSTFFITGSQSHIMTFFVLKDPKQKTETIKVDGIFFSYHGFSTLTNTDGQITLPLKTEKATFYLLITDQIEPIFMLYNTIANFQVAEKKNYSLFSIQKIFDKKTERYLWSVEPTEFKDQKILPLHTIVMHANPSSVNVETGVTPIKGNPAQFVLPPIYIKNTIKKNHDALNFLTNRQFFSSVEHTYNTSKQSVDVKI